MHFLLNLHNSCKFMQIKNTRQSRVLKHMLILYSTKNISLLLSDLIIIQMQCRRASVYIEHTEFSPRDFRCKVNLLLLLKMSTIVSSIKRKQVKLRVYLMQGNNKICCMKACFSLPLYLGKDLNLKYMYVHCQARM